MTLHWLKKIKTERDHALEKFHVESHLVDELNHSLREERQHSAFLETEMHVLKANFTEALQGLSRLVRVVRGNTFEKKDVAQINAEEILRKYEK